MDLLATAPDLPADLPSATRAVLLTGPAGFLFANFTAQLLSAHFGAKMEADLSAAGHSWTAAAFTLASSVGVVTAQPLEQRFGMRRCFVGGALLLAAFGLLQALVPSQSGLLAMRAFKRLTSGSFGPRALLAAFMLCRDGRLSVAAALTVFFLFVAGVIGCVMFGASGSVLGSRGLLLVQFVPGLLMALAGVRRLPPVSRKPVHSMAPSSATAVALRSRAP